MTSICIVSQAAHGAMTGGREGHAGGVERQTTMMARWLARRGHTVSLLVWDEGQPHEMIVDGVRVIALCRRDAGVPGVRFFHPRWTSLSRGLREADAEVYYQNCAEYVTGQVALWTRRHRRRFVYSVASDPECDPRLPSLRHLRERVLFRYGLRHADRILVQTDVQRSMLQRGFGLTGSVLPMPCAGTADDAFVPPDPFRGGAPRVVWVGRISGEKRLAWVIDIAAALPEVMFEIAGAPADRDADAAAVIARASALANIRFLGKVARDQMPGLYQDALALLCTSMYEGFPNTFLEAWSHGVPVISSVDPDSLIASRGLGLVATDQATLANAVRRCASSPEAWLAMSARARHYYAERHTPDRALPLFEQVLVDAVRSPGLRTS